MTGFRSELHMSEVKAGGATARQRTERTGTMASITITTVKCIRKQDLRGKDESTLCIAGLEVWDAKMAKGDRLHPNVSRNFSDNVLVELKERDNNRKEKSLGRWTVNDTPTPTGNPPLTATSSGYHYEVYFDVA
jgi:hypothetical protein